MATRYVLDINNNDGIEAVIRKCNTNFKAIVEQLDRQTRRSSGAVEQSIEEAVDYSTDYENQRNKPQIEGTTLVGNKLLPEINVHDVTEMFIDSLVYGPDPPPPGPPVVVTLDDYRLLKNLPQIEGTELVGNRTLGELNVNLVTEQQIDEIVYG